MTQAALDFGREHRTAEAYRAVMRTVNDAVDALGLGVAAGACVCRTQDLSDALTGRTNRYLRLEWLLAITDIAPPDFRIRIVRALAEWQGLSVVATRKLTPEERLALLEQKVANQFGPAGLALVEEARR